MSPAHRQTIGIVAAVVIVVSGAAIWRQARPPSPRGPEHNWFYDLNTAQLFPGPVTEVPPIAAPSGPLPDGSPAGVRAHVFGCGDCSEARRVIAYLETYTPEQKARLAQWHDRARRTEPPANGQAFQPDLQFLDVLSGAAALVKRPDDAEWVTRASPEGQALTADSIPACPGGSAPQICRP